MEFCHIAPTEYIRPYALASRRANLVLAHLVKSDNNYVCAYNDVSLQRGDVRILDNSAFELYSAGLPMFDGTKLVALGRKVNATHIVMPDYPGEHPEKTIAAANTFGPQFRDAGFGTFFVPQGSIGSVDEYLDAFYFAATSDVVDYIGISILAAPNAYGVNAPGNIQRPMSRIALMLDLARLGLIEMAKRNGKRIHFLGMLDGPREIEYARMLPRGIIDTWDSSAAVWAGIHDIRFDRSPTGLIGGKVASHVDFDLEFNSADNVRFSISHNIKYVDDLVNDYNKWSYCQ